MAETQFGTFEELLEMAAEPLRPIMIKLRERIMQLNPDVVETVRLGDKAATYGVGPKKMKEGYCYVLPHAKWVNLGFYQGVSLDDPSGILEGTGKKLRHIKIKSLDDADNPALQDLIEAAHQERKEATS